MRESDFFDGMKKLEKSSHTISRVLEQRKRLLTTRTLEGLSCSLSSTKLARSGGVLSYPGRSDKLLTFITSNF